MRSGVFHDDAFNHIGDVFAVVAAFFQPVERFCPGHDENWIFFPPDRGYAPHLDTACRPPLLHGLPQ